MSAQSPRPSEVAVDNPIMRQTSPRLGTVGGFDKRTRSTSRQVVLHLLVHERRNEVVCLEDPRGGWRRRASS
jgi:hypothetical protein